MSSNINIQRVCLYCGCDFLAKTTKTKYCSHKCNSRAYKENQRNIKISASVSKTKEVNKKPIEEINKLEFLTAKQTAKLLNASTKTVYNLINTGKLSAINLGQRITRIRRIDIDKIF
ncbi:helix-turn-helix domain-containing protein [Arcicella rosea]|uniref:helix-turn-helix domain-containing protein n=1 Tax=Arcicella rosea TaxID=502909 RepID=UPI00160C0BD3|nr:helix-turn-helix domain-containing protein [Arcicella rosea]